MFSFSIMNNTIELMDSKLFKAAIVGDVNFLNETNNVVKHKGANNSPLDYWLRRTSQNNHIIHVASAHNRAPDFVKEALRRYPSLISQQNVEGDTCLHVAVAKSNVEIVEAILAVCDAKTQGQLWSSKNLDGDTPLHVALGKPRDVAWVKFVLGLSKVHLSSLPLLNNSNESPLHLYVRHYCIDLPQHEMQQKATQKQIRALIQANKSCACIKDKQGLTPLLQAAKNSCLLVVRIIVEECPESIEICDTNGRTFLHLIKKVLEYHYQQFKNLLGIDVINALKNRDDNQGNTALHLAVQRHDIVAVRVLLECCVDLTIKNKEGVSAFDIIQSETTLLAKLMEVHTVEKQLMDIELITSIEKGNLTLLNERGVKYNDIYYLSQTLDGSNIIHLAIQKNQVEWAEKALLQFPQLIYQVNTQGENPLHIAAKFGNPTAALVARSVLNCTQKVMEGTLKVLFPINPLMVKNVRGNTPLHEVFYAGNYEFALDLINGAPQAASVTNHNGETPLHLFAKFGTLNKNQLTKETIISALVTTNRSIASMRDNEGFTPALRAAQSSRLSLCVPIVILSPESIELHDPKGRTVLHHFIHYDSFDEFVGNGPLDPLDILWNTVPGLDTLRAAQDEDGNTPLHYALKEGDINMAQFLVDRCVKAQVRLELTMLDNQRNSVLKLLALHPNSSVHLAMKERVETCMGKREVAMKNKLYEAVVKGDLANLLNQKDVNKQKRDDDDFTETDFLSRTINGSSIVDLAIKHGHSKCAKKALQYFPQLMIQVNTNGECPLHTAAKFDNDASKTVMECFVECYNKAPKTAFVTSSPFQMRNSSGNTPLHEALRAGNFVIALSMLELNSSPASMTNHVGESPLHVFARYGLPYTPTETQEIIVSALVTENRCAYARDIDGFTPLLRAVQCGRLTLCRTILKLCPQSIEICDPDGKSILHHLVNFTSSNDIIGSGPIEFLVGIFDKIPGLDALRAKQDVDGNTPLHYAIKEGDLTLAKMLLEMCIEKQSKEELYKVDNHGNSILSLLVSHPNSFWQMTMKEKIENLLGLKSGLMKDDIYNTIVRGNLSTLLDQRDDDDDFFSQTKDGSSIVHLAIKANDSKGVDNALKRLPRLIIEIDANGDTPLHIAAKFDNSASKIVLRSCLQSYSEVPDKRFATYAPWLAQNTSGNTPLHEALSANNYSFAIELISFYGRAVVVTNNVGETPLHILARCGTNTDKIQKEIVRKLIKADNCIAYKRDEDGLTPLLRAAKGRLWLCCIILSFCPQGLELRDLRGKNFLHHCLHFKSLVNDDIDNGLEVVTSLWDEVLGIDFLRVAQDMDGNTPLHYAIKEGDIPLACMLVERCVKAPTKQELFKVDNQGNSILDLLASYPKSSIHMEMKEKIKKCMAPLVDSEWYDLVLDDCLSYSPNTRDNFLHQSAAGSNILHLAIVQDLPKIAEKALEHTPQLIVKADPNGNNPLHIAAKLNNSVAQQVVRFCKGCTNYRPWAMRNASGNTPLHEALRASNCNIALTLIDIFPDAASMTNNAGETPLHLFARYGIYTDLEEHEIVRKLHLIHWPILCMRDGDGFTPLIRSVQSGRLLISLSIMLAFPQSIEIRDFKGRSVLHHFRNFTTSADVIGNGSTTTFSSIWKKCKGIDALRALQDVDGNTPLHYAIKEGDIPLACLLVDRCVEATNKMELSMLDNEGNSVLDLLASHPNSPVHMALKEKIEKCNDQKVKMDKELYEKVVKRELNEHLVDVDNNIDWGRDLSCLFKEDDDLNDEAENDENSISTSSSTYSELLSRAADGSNILHLAIKHRSASAALKIFMKWPHLVLESDSNGDNPIHIAAKFRHSGGLKLLRSLLEYYNISNDKFITHPPFGMKNANGNTPLHEALHASNSSVALELIDLYSEAALIQNNACETPLHLFARYGTYTHKKTLDAFVKVLDVGLMAASTRDFEGFTPLLRAVQSGRIQVALSIAARVPGSIEVCDFKGRTMLHHLRIHANEMVETSMRGGEISFSDFIEGADSLRVARDVDGNTPLHYSLKNGNFATAKLLMERCASSDQRTELTILNHHGESILDLLRMQVAKLEKDGDGNAILQLAVSQADVLNMNELIAKDLSSEKMTKELYEAAVKGYETIFNGINEKIAARKSVQECYLSQAPDGSNIIHLALRYGKAKFIEQALDLFPELIFRRDYNCDTPAHVAARNYKARSSSKDISFAAEMVINKAEDRRTKVFDNSTRSWTPYVWDFKNSQGNTPLHEAVRGGRLDAIPKLFEMIEKSACKTSDVTSMANNDGETPLHVYARYAATPSKSCYYRRHKVEELYAEALSQLIEKSCSVMYMRDKDGLTPLLRAAVSGNIDLARAIWKNNPQAMQLRDTNGRTFLHLMDFSKIMSKPYEIFNEVEIDALRAVQDDEGNTPLHFAIKSDKYKLAKILMQRSVRANDCRELYLANKQGEYIQTLLAQDDVPNEVINVYKKFDPTYISNYELRSSYGITRKQIKERADSLSVIAALLATITFAAAFTVPGGLNQDIGIPIFIRKIAFKAFMLLDALAMCGSVLVLYFLVWVMIGSKPESFFLIDMSITLLQGSFVATILAFAAGVFVTTHHEIKWLAILVCVLCGALTLMLNRTALSCLSRFLIKYCVPYVNRFYWKYYSYC